MSYMYEVFETNKKANNEIDKVVKYIEKHIDMFDTMNLKMYEAFYYTSQLGNDYPLLADRATDLFYEWCNHEYDLAEEYCNSHFGVSFYVMRHHIGRTSSFHITDFKTTDIEQILTDALIEYGAYDYCQLYDFETEDNRFRLGKYKNYEEQCHLDYYLDELTYIAEGFSEYFFERIKDAEQLYEYLNGFKKNQLIYFKEYLEFEEEEVEYLKELQDKEEETDKEECNRIIAKYGINEEDLLTLKQTIYTC